MSRDIVEWLRTVAPDARGMDPSDWTGLGWPLKNGMLAAADEIEQLRRKIGDLETIIKFMENGDEIYVVE